ncbi:MAG TPA: hypothetical protein VLX92_22885 [Kofleriaceae bacterium]|nr:hypothetical protein [Kofleriaceae bacterium]
MRTILLLAPLAACAGGALHQATLVGQCAEQDTACSRRHPLAPLAIGARFHPELATDIAGTATPKLVLDSAAPDVLAVERGALVARAEGAAAVLISTDDGSVVDFVHVWALPITEITLARRDGDRVAGTVGLAVGEDVTLEPALWNGAQRLAGDADLAWTSDNAAAIALLPDGSAARRRIRARAPGKATITVALGDARTTLAIEVVP